VKLKEGKDSLEELEHKIENTEEELIKE